ncbi:hypothetical protein HUJ04_001001 [Dendroctonus ponderosae]
MSLQNNFSAFLGAAVLGVIGAAGMFFAEHYRQRNMRNAVVKDLARLEKEISQLKLDLQQLQNQSHIERRSRPKRPNRAYAKKSNSIVSTTTDDYLSAANIDSSDLEFYDLSDEESKKKPDCFQVILKELDEKLELKDIQVIEEVLQRLEDLCLDYPGNPEFLYRIGKAHHKLADACDDKELKEKYLNKGIDACSSALKVVSDHADVHKWYAVLIGSRSKLVPFQDRIHDGNIYKKHVEIALSLNPNDASLHFMLGMFNYELAGLKWYEKKIAAALFGSSPESTYEEACFQFLETERLSTFEWKENRLMIAKCKIAMREYKTAVEWLYRATQGHCTSLDGKVDNEIDTLLQKYKQY